MPSVTLSDHELHQLEHERLLAPLRDTIARLRALLREGIRFADPVTVPCDGVLWEAG